MKKLFLLAALILSPQPILADYGHMTETGYGMMWGGAGYVIFWFVGAIFLFSIIFWSTYNLIARKRPKR